MALSKMKLVNIIGMMESLDEVVAALGRSGVFQPDDTADFFSDQSELIPISSPNEYAAPLDRLRMLMNGAGITPRIVDSKDLDEENLEAIEGYLQEIDEELGVLIQNRTDIRTQLAACEENIKGASHFASLDVDVSKITACEFIVTRFGKLPKDSYLKLQAYSESPYIEFFSCSKDEQYYWGAYVTPISEADEVDHVFSQLYFERINIDNVSGKPLEYIKEQKGKQEALRAELKTLDQAISAYADRQETKLQQIFSALCKRHAFMAIKNHACKYRGSFILLGWIPTEYEGVIKKLLKPIYSVEVTFTKAEDESKHSPPVKLKNRFFFRPFEYYTEMYGLPNSREIDPSWFIALTYTLLFGIMFADVGHGLMLLVAAIYMYKKMKMPLGRLLMPCGISSTVFGFVFGSVFGFEEALNPVYKALFGLDEKPIDVMEGNTTMLLIYSAVGIGVILLIAAMMLNIVSCLKRRDIGGALFGVNGLSGLVFYSSLIIGLVCSMVFDIHIMNTAYILLLIVLPLILIFLRDPLSKLVKGERKLIEGTVGSFIVDNLFEMFEVALSYVTNTMSFLRVGAFILVHAGMMKVVFVLAGMFGPIGYVITVILGNVLVMALEALLVGIQVLRLEYYELFSRFYIGDGRKYEPVRVQDKV